jgi:hypothetical protein
LGEKARPVMAELWPFSSSMVGCRGFTAGAGASSAEVLRVRAVEEEEEEEEEELASGAARLRGGSSEDSMLQLEGEGVSAAKESACAPEGLDF